MGVVVENNVYYLRYLVYFVRRSIHVEHRYRAGEAPSVDPSGLNKVIVDEAAYCSIVKQGLNRVDLSGVCCENFYKQDERYSASIQYTCRELFG